MISNSTSEVSPVRGQVGAEILTWYNSIFTSTESQLASAGALYAGQQLSDEWRWKQAHTAANNSDQTLATTQRPHLGSLSVNLLLVICGFLTGMDLTRSVSGVDKTRNHLLRTSGTMW